MALSQCFILSTKPTIIKRTSTIPPAVPGFLGGTLGSGTLVSPKEIIKLWKNLLWIEVSYN